MKNIKLIWIILIIASLASVGCASTKKTVLEPVRKPEPVAESVEVKVPETCRIQFPRPLVILPNIQVSDKDDPKEIVEFALMLYEKGRFRNAAKFFLDAAALDEENSQDNRFRLACLSAAATCFLEESDFEDFHQVVERIKGEMDRFQAASIENKISMLIAVSERLRGEKVELNPDTPINVRGLFR